MDQTVSTDLGETISVLKTAFTVGQLGWQLRAARRYQRVRAVYRARRHHVAFARRIVERAGGFGRRRTSRRRLDFGDLPIAVPAARFYGQH